MAKLRVSIVERFAFSQPEDVAVFRGGGGIRSFARPEATVQVSEDQATAVSLASGATIAELVEALRAIKVSSRDVIAILQGIKRAGAYKRHILTKKTTKRKRQMRRRSGVDQTNTAAIRNMLPYSS